jgi:hypothetical protein
MSALTLPASLLEQLQILRALTLAANQHLKLALCLSFMIIVISPGAVVNCVCAAGRAGHSASPSNNKFTCFHFSITTPTIPSHTVVIVVAAKDHHL